MRTIFYISICILIFPGKSLHFKSLSHCHSERSRRMICNNIHCISTTLNVTDSSTNITLNIPLSTIECLKKEVLHLADSFLLVKTKTITDTFCIRSAGTRHDYYSEGDYWWPDTANPVGPYIRRDGLSNPDNFLDHRLLLHRLSTISGTLASAYKITGDEKYAAAANNHFKAWFADTTTLMNPSLNFSQAIKGRATGRKVGVIDGLHLIEVAKAIEVCWKSGVIPEQDYQRYKTWFSSFLNWLVNHPFGKEEMKAKNNHATTWTLQAAVFARFTNNTEVADYCKNYYKNVLLPNQMETDGSFPLELARTKPYGYSLFNLDAMAMLCQVLSDSTDNLWEFTTPDGKSIKKGIEFMYPFVQDKNSWTYPPDAMYYEYWPVAHPFLIFAAEAYQEKKYLNLWEKLEHFPDNYEVIRNLPVRNPTLWFN